jgi:hypothetical protein
MNTGE